MSHESPVDTSLTRQVQRLIGSRPWNCEFIRARALLSSRTVECLERSGNWSAAQVYVDAVMADVLLDLRVGLERQLQMVIRPHRAISEASRTEGSRH